MNIGIINGSPKYGDSTSALIINHIKLLLQDQTLSTFHINKRLPSEQEFEDIYQNDAILLVFPLYIDSVPSHLLKFLIESEKKLKGHTNKPIIHAIIINGFYEGIQNHVAATTIKNWCLKAGVKFGQVIGSGAGEMLPIVKDIPMGHGPNTNIGNALNSIAYNITKKNTGDPIYISPNWPRFLWKIQSSYFIWSPRAKANGIKKRELLKKL